MKAALSAFWLLLAGATLTQLLFERSEGGSTGSDVPLIVLASFVGIAAAQLLRAFRVWAVFILIGSSLFLLVVVTWSAAVAAGVDVEQGDTSRVPIVIFGTLGVSAILSLIGLLRLLRQRRVQHS